MKEEKLMNQNNSQKLLHLFQGLMSNDEAEAMVHALDDIEGSLMNIYNDLLPKILKANEKEEIRDLIWDMREEFRHIDYHLKDAKLAD